jgi:Xaa-Pro aminopeptidase
MYQSFDDTADPSVGAPRLALLRAELNRRGLAGFLVPRADEHQGEYVPPSAERLKWLTGFSGSAGAAVVLAERAAIFVDGRYTLQVRDQVDMTLYEQVHLHELPPSRWLPAAVKAGDAIGVDPWLHTIDGVRKLKAALEAAGASLRPVDNLVDAIWHDRPAAPKGRVTIQPLDLAGEAVADKRARLAAAIAAKGAALTVLTQPDSIAWLFNIRGADVPHTPLTLAFALVGATGKPRLFIDPDKLGPDERAHLAAEADLLPPAAFADALAAVPAGTAVLVDPTWVAEAIGTALTAAGARLVEGDDPVTLMKAVKNGAELDGARAAHVRDGVAFARFLRWFDGASAGDLDEIGVVTALEGFRRETGQLLDVSFDSIAGAGPNGAIVHYRVSRATNRRIDRDSVFLIDSGAQFRDGTTDITRTMAVGTPPDEIRDRFTRVLKGNIAIAAARFPVGTTGAQLDTLARMALWQAGLDYDHGTGHGVGSYLSVHEGPQRISKLGATPLQAGMILSNEPGYYKTGQYGLRIETLVIVTEATEIPGGDRPMHGFETITLAPIDRRLIVPALMTADEIAWLDAYHARVFAEIGPQLDDATRAWLQAATAPLSSEG